jgi:hypothetical protein
MTFFTRTDRLKYSWHKPRQDKEMDCMGPTSGRLLVNTGIFVEETIENLVCQPAGRRENDFAIGSS